MSEESVNSPMPECPDAEGNREKRGGWAEMVSQAADVVSNRATNRKCCGMLQPNVFDGTEDWETYRIQFEAVSRFNEWKDPAKACALVASLRGEALVVLYALNEDEVTDYKKVTRVLGRRFAKTYLANKLRNDLQNKRVKLEDGVSLQQFEANLTRAVRLAYPDRTLAQLESIRLFAFVNGIEWNGEFEDWLDLMLSIFSGKVSNTEEMMEYVLQREQMKIKASGRDE